MHWAHCSATCGFSCCSKPANTRHGGTAYFSGGYNTVNHTCILPGNTVNGLQIECNSTVRSSYLNRKIFANSLASSLSQYFFLSTKTLALIIATLSQHLPLQAMPMFVQNKRKRTRPHRASRAARSTAGWDCVGTAQHTSTMEQRLAGNVSVIFTP